MLPTKRYRLLACVLVMLAVLGAASLSRIGGGPPRSPFGLQPNGWGLGGTIWYGKPRTTNPFDQLHDQIAYPGWQGLKPLTELPD